MLTLHEALRDLATKFDRAGLDQPNMLARRLVAHVLGQSREWVIAHSDIALEPEHLGTLDVLVARLLAHEPLAYIVQQRAFYGMDLYVDGRVLIPRPETEMLVELTLQKFATPNPPVPNSQSVLDPRCGQVGRGISCSRWMVGQKIAIRIQLTRNPLNRFRSMA